MTFISRGVIAESETHYRSITAVFLICPHPRGYYRGNRGIVAVANTVSFSNLYLVQLSAVTVCRTSTVASYASLTVFGATACDSDRSKNCEHFRRLSGQTRYARMSCMIYQSYDIVPTHIQRVGTAVSAYQTTEFRICHDSLVGLLDISANPLKCSGAR